MKLLHQFYAWLCGYFWMPCPKCGEMFGGHQHRPFGAHVKVMEADGEHHYCVCPACDTPELRAENQREWQEHTGKWIGGLISSGELGIKLMPGQQLDFRIGPQVQQDESGRNRAL